MPNSATTGLKESATRIVAYEMALQPPDGKESRSFRVFDRMREPLVHLTGLGGFRSLLSRSLVLASTDAPWLHELKIAADGSLDGLPEWQAKLTQEDITQGEIALTARLIGLLVTFIGPALTQQLLKDIWPKMDQLVFDTEAE